MSSADGTQPCPKCSYLRRPSDTAPDWQCPSCGIAYHKYASYLERVQQVAQPRTATMAVEPPVDDGSVWSLLVANLFVLVLALLFDWHLVDMMLVYWAQSLMIGISYLLRILSLEKFSTENFYINGRAVEPTTMTKWKVGMFFVLHFGIFHLVYVSFIFSGEFGEPMQINWEFFVCLAAFAFNHAYSYRYHRDMDRAGTPNIGTLMFTPYARVIPMHMMIIFGGLLPQSFGIWIFGALKTGADTVMHQVEHKRLSRH